MKMLPALILLLIMGLAVTGYVKNLVNLVECDFASPYKAEVIRGVGVVVPPVGVIAGWITIQDGE